MGESAPIQHQPKAHAAPPKGPGTAAPQFTITATTAHAGNVKPFAYTDASAIGGRVFSPTPKGISSALSALNLKGTSKEFGSGGVTLSFSIGKDGKVIPSSVMVSFESTTQGKETKPAFTPGTGENDLKGLANHFSRRLQLLNFAPPGNEQPVEVPIKF